MCLLEARSFLRPSYWRCPFSLFLVLLLVCYLPYSIVMCLCCRSASVVCLILSNCLKWCSNQAVADLLPGPAALACLRVLVVLHCWARWSCYVLYTKASIRPVVLFRFHVSIVIVVSNTNYVKNETIIDKDLKTMVTGPIKIADRRNWDKLARDYLKNYTLILS